MAEYSFDIVSKIDVHEADNALGQTNKELSTRYDFRNAQATASWSSKEEITLSANAEDRVKAALEVLIERLVRRGIDAKALDISPIKTSGKIYNLTARLKQGISSEDTKKITKIIRDEGPKAVKTQITGDEIRVSSKSRDDLQATISLLKKKDLPVALQFTNYR